MFVQYMKCNRTHSAIISYGLYLYFSSRSLRLAAKRLESTTIRSQVMSDRCLVKEIFVDETLLRVDGHDFWL